MQERFNIELEIHNRAEDDNSPRCKYEPAPYVWCIREENHGGEHFFILPESFFEFTQKAKQPKT